MYRGISYAGIYKQTTCDVIFKIRSKHFEDNMVLSSYKFL